ncbi:MAG: DsbA family protein [Sphingomonadales bacterium]|nr:DsbA family protein [Sphingomonadales bacterium]
MFRFIAISALTLGLAACDDAPKTTDTTSTEATSVTTSTAPADSQKIVVEYGAEEIKNGAALGELYMGSPDAPVTMIEYASLTCSHCANFHNDVLPQIKENYINTGKVRLVYRNFVTNQPDLVASMMARCVVPEKSFEMMGVLFERQRQWLSSDDPLAALADIARKSGMNRAKFDACVRNDELKRSLIALRQLGLDDNIEGTPTFIINGALVNNPRDNPYEELKKIIEDAL